MRTPNWRVSDQQRLFSSKYVSSLCTTFTPFDSDYIAAPIRPSIAYALPLLRQFDLCLMSGPISKQAFATALREHLSIEVPYRLPDLTKTWRYVYFNWKRVDYLAETHLETILKITTEVDFCSSVFSNLCPCCFATPPGRPPRKVCCCVDGNMQHRRGKWINPGETHEYTTPMFVSRTQDNPFSNNSYLEEPEDKNGCGHRFLAADQTKPKSMVNFDETGLMGCVCRHGIPLRYLDIFAGERSESTLKLMNAVLEECGEGPVTFHYDIACRFQLSIERLRKHREDLDKERSRHRDIKVILNGFHAFAHELKCRLLYGPLHYPDIGLTNSESNESDWSGKGYLVAPGRKSGPINRTMMLEHQSLHSAMSKRRAMFARLSKRWKAAVQAIEKNTKRLEELLEELLKGTAELPSLPLLPTMEHLTQFLKSMIDDQLDYFKHRPSPSTLKEQLPQELWRIFQSLKTEVQLRKDIREMQRRLDTAPNAVDYINLTQLAQRAELQRLKNELEKTQAETDHRLREKGQDRLEWNETSPQWIFFNNIDVIQEQDNLVREITQLYGARLLEIRDIRHRIRGQKTANKLLASLRRRVPQALELIKALSRLQDRIPQQYRCDDWNNKHFEQKYLEDHFDEPLWSIEQIRDRLLSDAAALLSSARHGVNRVETEAPATHSRTTMAPMWKEPSISRGIDALLHLEKSQEELKIIAEESQAAFWWLERRADALLVSSGSWRNNYFYRKLVWDIIHMLEGAIASQKECEELRTQPDIQRLEGKLLS